MNTLLPSSFPRACACAVAAALFSPAGLPVRADPSVIAYVGTGTESPVNGIYAIRCNEVTGAMEPLGVVASTPHAAFLAMHPTGRFLYAVNESNPNSSNGHTVTAFAVDGAGPKLNLINVAPCGGDRPCHIVVDRTGRYAFVANYGSGTVAALPVRSDGGLEPPEFVFQDPQPDSKNPRQAEPHAHSVALDRTDKFLYSCDLGADKVMMYRFDAAAGTLVRNSPAFIAVPPGSGPRHIAIGAGGGQAFVLNEIASTLLVYDRRLDDGSLLLRQSLSTFPAGWHGQSTAAEIEISNSGGNQYGQFVYTSNRGHDSIALFAPGPDRNYHLVETTPCGKEPRFFTFLPGGKFLLVANQGGDTIREFSVDPTSGQLTPTQVQVSASQPVCIVFGYPAP
jgi:6-phosphogluconolactonase